MKRQQRNGRRGAVFSVRVTDEERATLENHQRAGGGPRRLGPWMLWRALTAGAVVPPRGAGPTWSGTTDPGAARLERVLPDQVTAVGVVPQLRAPVVPELQPHVAVVPALRERIILDLCAGSGAWSEPYAAAGYDVRRVTLPDGDVRTYEPPANVWGVLAGPPCEKFSLARRKAPTDAEYLAAVSVVLGCLRIIALCRPQWWAIENPAGRLSRWLGTPRDTWEPCDFGDPWTKRTCLWGRFTVPPRGPFVEPLGGMDARNDSPPGSTIAARRAVTPAGFARAFAAVNP